MPEEAPTLFNTDVKELNPYWVDPAQPLLIPVDPLHYKAHKLQILLDTLLKQAGKNPAQFNSGNYINALNEYTKCVTEIKSGKTADEVLDEGGMDQVAAGGSQAVGHGEPDGVDPGISADNPFAGKGLSTTEPVPLSAGLFELPGHIPSNK